MGNRGRSEPNFFGGYTHYDEKGHKVGRSEPGLFGGYTDYDASGRKIGHTDPGFLGGYNHYDNHGRKTGHSEPGFFGSYNHYDASGKPSGSSDPGLFGGYSNNSTQGCYVATCVYGSYDCPEVWTLRRFRDFFLAEHLLGRWFIRCYYMISPTIVRLVGKKAWFQGFWRTRLDRLVSRLWSRGYDHTPYQDREW